MSELLEEKAVTGLTRQVLLPQIIDIWKKIAGPTDAEKIDLIITQFSTTAKTSGKETDANALLLRAANYLTDDTGNLKKLTEADFDISCLHGLCGVGKKTLEPREIHDALHNLWRYAKKKGHTQDGLFTDNGRAHLILAITAMVTQVFFLDTPDSKITSLELCVNFLSEVQKSPLTKTGIWKDDTMKDALRLLKENIAQVIEDIQRKALEHEVRTHIRAIEVGIYACREYARIMLPTFYEETDSSLIDGRPRLQDLDDSFLSCLLEQTGFTLMLEKDNIQELLSHDTLSKASTVPVKFSAPTKIQESKSLGYYQKLQQHKLRLKPEDKKKSDARDFFAQLIVVCGNVAPDAKRSYDQIQWDPKTGYPKEEITESASCFLSPQKFLIALSSLATREAPNTPRLDLDEQARLVLVTKEIKKTTSRKSFFSSSNKEEIESFEKRKILCHSGFSKGYLEPVSRGGTKKTSEMEEAKAKQRKLVLQVQIEQTKLVYTIFSLLDLCEKIHHLYQHYGEVYGALFVKNAFPATAILIQSAIQNVSATRAKISLIKSGVSEEKLSIFLEINLKYSQQMTRQLESMLQSTQAAQDRNQRILDEVVSGHISLKRDLKNISDSLGECVDLFALTGVISSLEQSALKKKVEEIRSRYSLSEKIDETILQMALSEKKEGTPENFRKKPEDIGTPPRSPTFSYMMSQQPPYKHISAISSPTTSPKKQKMDVKKIDEKKNREFDFYSKDFQFLELVDQCLEEKEVFENFEFDSLIKNCYGLNSDFAKYKAFEKILSELIRLDFSKKEIHEKKKNLFKLMDFLINENLFFLHMDLNKKIKEMIKFSDPFDLKKIEFVIESIKKSMIVMEEKMSQSANQSGYKKCLENIFETLSSDDFLKVEKNKIKFFEIYGNYKKEYNFSLDEIEEIRKFFNKELSEPNKDKLKKNFFVEEEIVIGNQARDYLLLLQRTKFCDYQRERNHVLQLIWEVLEKYSPKFSKLEKKFYYIFFNIPIHDGSEKYQNRMIQILVQEFLIFSSFHHGKIKLAKNHEEMAKKMNEKLKEESKSVSFTWVNPDLNKDEILLLLFVLNQVKELDSAIYHHEANYQTFKQLAAKILSEISLKIKAVEKLKAVSQKQTKNTSYWPF